MSLDKKTLPQNSTCSLLLAGYCGLILLLLFPITVSASIDNLAFVHIIYRHGDRSPSNTFPTSPYNKTFWKDGWSQLTKRGMLQMYELGQYLRTRYDGFLDARYTKDQIYIRSTDKDRTLQSASANLAGLYPPVDDQKWNPAIPNWQPIPIHTVPADQDILLNTGIDCPAYDALFAQQVKPIIERMNKAYREVFDYIKSFTGLNKVVFEDIGDVYGPLFRAGEQGAELPTWSQSIWNKTSNMTVYDLILELKRLSRTTEFDSVEKAKFRAGYLLGDIVSRMTRIAEGKANKGNPSKMMVYSAHDGTMLALLYALNVSNHLIVPYASCLLIELYKSATTIYNSQSDPFRVKVYLRNDTSAEPYELSVPGCEQFSCPLKRFAKLTEKSSLYPDSKRRKYCKVEKSKNSTSMES